MTVDVIRLWPDQREGTIVWLSETAAERIESACPDPATFLTKLRSWAEHGLGDFTSEDGTLPVRPEGGKAYRVWWKRGSLFRAIGFYNGSSEFVILDALAKRGQKYSGSQRKRIQAVSQIAESGSWRKIGG